MINGFLKKRQGMAKGFTLIEILVVIGIIAILAAVVIIAINPARQFAQARNSTRTANVSAILNAIGQSIADNKGQLTGCLAGIPVVATTPATLTSSVGLKISSGGTASDVDLSCLTPTYIPALPFDPGTGTTAAGSWTSSTSYDTKYNVFSDTSTGGRITVFAPTIELSNQVSSTR